LSAHTSECGVVGWTTVDVEFAKRFRVNLVILLELESATFHKLHVIM